MSEQEEMKFGWFLPTAGDGKYVGVAPEREPSLDYLIQVAQTAETAGFEFVLIPTGGACLDAWVVGSAVMSHTKTLRPLVAIRPGLVTPVLAARMGAALDQLSGGRAMINVVTGSSVRDLEELGDPLAHAHDERYERASEYMEVMKRSWTQSAGLNLTEFAGSGAQSNEEASEDNSEFNGKYYNFKGPVGMPETVQKPYPPFYLGGSSPIAKRVAVNTQIHSSCGASRMTGFRSRSKKLKSFANRSKRKPDKIASCVTACGHRYSSGIRKKKHGRRLGRLLAKYHQRPSKKPKQPSQRRMQPTTQAE